MAVDKLNTENRLMVDRLKQIKPVLDVDKLERDFQRHKTIGSQLRRRQMIPTNETPTSPASPTRNTNGAFDADLYVAQHTGGVMLTKASETGKSANTLLSTAGENVLLGGSSTPSFNYGSGTEINTMQDFRRQVISKKFATANHLQESLSKPTTATGKADSSAKKSFEMFHDAQ